jgi:GNAT superfamily N-acetyltransferase
VRPCVQVRPAEPADLTDLATLCLEARGESAVGAQLCTDDGLRLRNQLGTLLAAPGGQVLVGLLDDEPAGLLLASVVGPSPFTDEVSLNLEAIYVAPHARRRGLGRALLARALDVATQSGVHEVYAAPLPGSRGMQRFLARVGFAPAAAHRVASAQALQRRLSGDQGTARRNAPKGIEDLIARRRRVRSAARAEAVAVRDQPEISAADQRRRSSISMQVSRAVQSRTESESTTTIS